MKGYKVFNPDWTCRGFQYKVCETYKMDDFPLLCKRGFHFCQKLKNCFRYYPSCKDVKIAEVEALGDVKINPYEDVSKFCTNKIKILREIPFEDLIIDTEEKIIHLKTLIDYDFEYLSRDDIREVNEDVVLYGTVQAISKERIYIPEVNDYFIDYTIKYTAITDIKEKTHGI